jgi:hypothetical protein
MQTVAITDFKLMSPKLAHVVISFTGRQNKESLRAALAEKLQKLAMPVEDSFRIVKAGVAIGFVRSNTEVRVVSENEIRASYRVMSSNIMRDNTDKSLWEVKDGKAGKYLARYGNEDLSELINASVHRRSDIPRLSQITMTKAGVGEFATFVTPSGDLDHGFVAMSNSAKARVVSATTKMPMTIENEAIVSLAQVSVPKEHKQAMVKAKISPADKAQACEYWRRLYFYDQEYLNEVLDQVNNDSAL